MSVTPRTEVFKKKAFWVEVDYKTNDYAIKRDLEYRFVGRRKGFKIENIYYIC